MRCLLKEHHSCCYELLEEQMFFFLVLLKITAMCNFYLASHVVIPFFLRVILSRFQAVVLLYLLTWIGGIFNLLTLVILGEFSDRPERREAAPYSSEAVQERRERKKALGENWGEV